MRTVRYIAWTAVAIVAAVTAFLWFAQQRDGGIAGLVGGSFGAPFTLRTADGETVTDANLKGKPHLVFFGFTHCPEICPTTIFEMSGWMEKLGPQADSIGVYFITVDPARDTPELLKNYFSPFDKRIVPLTGSEEEIAQAAKVFRAFYKKVPTGDGEYTMDHTASVYLLHGDGSFSGTISYGEDPDTALAKLRRLVENG
jgi:protein SCO1/2